MAFGPEAEEIPFELLASAVPRDSQIKRGQGQSVTFWSPNLQVHHQVEGVEERTFDLR